MWTNYLKIALRNLRRQPGYTFINIAVRNFSSETSADKTNTYVINQATADVLGWTPQEAVGKPLSIENSDGEVTGEVIGVTENFHLASFHERINPVVLQLREPTSWSKSGVLITRLHPGGVSDGIDHIREQIARYGSEASFQYTFLDEEFAAMYRTERRLAGVLVSCTLLAVFVACLGLLGLAAFMAERRTQEIGIRKALGASVASIVGLLSKDFTKLAGLGFIMAVPAAYFLMRRWLRDFAYHIELGPGIFLLAGAVVLVVAFLSVSYQSIKASLTNPADALRYE